MSYERKRDQGARKYPCPKCGVGGANIRCTACGWDIHAEALADCSAANIKLVMQVAELEADIERLRYRIDSKEGYEARQEVERLREALRMCAADECGCLNAVDWSPLYPQSITTQPDNTTQEEAGR